SSSLLLLPPPPRSTLFPYTTLFRSRGQSGYDACNVWGVAAPFVQSTSFLKLREASIGYDLPESWAKVFGARSARVSVTGRNLIRSEEHTSELQSRFDLVCRLLLEKK